MNSLNNHTNPISGSCYAASCVGMLSRSVNAVLWYKSINSQFKFSPHPRIKKEKKQVSMFPGKGAETGEFRLNVVRTDADGRADLSGGARQPELWEHWESLWPLLGSQLNPNTDGRSFQETEKTEGRACLTCMQSSHFC